MPDLFVLATGQDDNIGDVVLRREYFDRLRRIGRLHIFVGGSSADFLDGLRLDEADECYSTLRQWHSAAWKALARGAVWFVDKPGELQLDRRTVVRQLKLLPLILAIRLRRGQVLRLGMAMRSVNARYLRPLRPLFRLSTKVLWRDTATGRAFGFGEVGPDWAFAWEGSDDDALDVDRADVAVSHRGDRDPPSEAFVASLAALTRVTGRRVVVVTQVRRDVPAAAELAEHLGAELIPWPVERTLAEHEDVVRAIYRRSALVVSDRLHALIVGMTEGAVPLCVSEQGEAKVERHIDAVGFEGSTLRLDGAVAPVAAFERQVERRKELLKAVRLARDELDRLTAELAGPVARRESRAR